MSASVSEQAILESLRQVPAERWGDVLHYLHALRNSGPAIRTGTDLSQSDLIGAWADRDDLGGSVEFARQLRHEAQTRREANHAAGH